MTAILATKLDKTGGLSCKAAPSKQMLGKLPATDVVCHCGIQPLQTVSGCTMSELKSGQSLVSWCRWNNHLPTKAMAVGLFSVFLFVCAMAGISSLRSVRINAATTRPTHVQPVNAGSGPATVRAREPRNAELILIPAGSVRIGDDNGPSERTAFISVHVTRFPDGPHSGNGCAVCGFRQRHWLQNRCRAIQHPAEFWMKDRAHGLQCVEQPGASRLAQMNQPLRETILSPKSVGTTLKRSVPPMECGFPRSSNGSALRGRGRRPMGMSSKQMNPSRGTGII